MSNKTHTLDLRPGLFALLGLLFIGLKLGGVITWSWLWVLAPFWLPLAIFLPIALIAFAVIAVTKS